MSRLAGLGTLGLAACHWGNYVLPARAASGSQLLFVSEVRRTGSTALCGATRRYHKGCCVFTIGLGGTGTQALTERQVCHVRMIISCIAT